MCLFNDKDLIFKNKSKICHIQNYFKRVIQFQMTPSFLSKYTINAIVDKIEKKI